jgi:subtilisin
MSEIKSVSNNDVAEASFDKKKLDRRQREKQIMNIPDEDDLQIVSLGKYGPLWVGGIEPTTSVKDTLWDFAACGLPYLWTQYGLRGEGVNVFVLDSGIDYHHSVFKQGESRLVTKSFVPMADANLDGCGHGTWVSGKIIGGGVGIAPKCNLYSLRVLDDSGTGKADFTNKALEWILKGDIFPHVVNMSLGGPKKNSKQEKLLWQLYKKGACIVVAAGNAGDDDRFYPADYSGVMAVAAVDKNNTRAEFSNYGAKIAVSAPGVACYSAATGQGFRRLQGTSMASPTVAGLITLGLSYALSKGLHASVELRDMIVDALEKSAQDLGPRGRDPYYGFGCIDGKGFFAHLDNVIRKM